MSWFCLFTTGGFEQTVPHTSHTPGGCSTTELHPQPAFSMLFWSVLTKLPRKDLHLWPYYLSPLLLTVRSQCPHHQDWLGNIIWNHQAICNKTKIHFYHKRNKPPLLTCLLKEWRNEKSTKTLGTTCPGGELTQHSKATEKVFPRWQQ